MKSVSAGFLLEQAKVKPDAVRKIVVQRRYWDGMKYTWETDGFNIDQPFFRTRAGYDSNVAALGADWGYAEQTSGALSWPGNPFINIGVGWEFGFDGRITGADAGGPAATKFYTIAFNTQSFNLDYVVYFLSDYIILNSTDPAGGGAYAYAIDMTVDRVIRLVLKDDASLDLYVGGVLVANLKNDSGFDDAFGTLQMSEHGVTGPITRQWYKFPYAFVDTPFRGGVSQISPLSWQADTDQLNVFKASNITLTVDNEDNQWDCMNPNGLFAGGYFHREGNIAGAGGGTQGFEFFLSRVHVYSGFMVDGVPEYLKLFTGYLAADPSFDLNARTVQLTVLGPETLLSLTSAEDMATQVVGETLGTGDGTTASFLTLNPGVGRVKNVYIDGELQTEGDDYTISLTSDPTTGASVNFIDPPEVGEVPSADYFYWPQSLLIEDIVDDLMAAAGVDSGDREITAAQFFDGIIAGRKFSSKDDWDGGTLTNIDTSEDPGRIQFDFTNTATKPHRIIDDTLASWNQVGALWTADAGVPHLISAPVSTALTASSITTTTGVNAKIGTFDFKFQNNSTDQSRFDFFFDADIDGSNVLQNDYCKLSVLASFQPAIGTAVTEIALNIVIAGVTVATAVAPYTPDTAEHEVQIWIRGNGRFRVVWDGTVIIDLTVPDGTDLSTLGEFIRLERFSGTSPFTNNGTIYFRDFNITDGTIESVWLSPITDTGVIPYQWLPYLLSAATAGGTVLSELNVSADGSTWDGWMPLTPGSNPPNALKQFWQLRLTIDVDATIFAPCYVSKAKIQSYAESLVVIMADFTGRSVWDALQALAAFTNYEVGVRPTSDSNGKFFFRPKEPDFLIGPLYKQDDFVADISGLTNGYDRLRTKVRVTYGTHTRESTNGSYAPWTATPDLDPVKRFKGENVFEFSADDAIQISPFADVATGMAKLFFDSFVARRRRFKATTKIAQQVDLGDWIQWLYKPDPNKETLLDMTYSRVIGARYDVDRMVCEFDMEGYG